MNFDITFEENNAELDVDFGEIQIISSGGAGYDQGYSEGFKKGYESCETAIEDDVAEQTELIAQIGEAVKGKALRDEFWDHLQNYGNRTNYDYMFQNSAFEYIDAKYPIIDTDLHATFNNSKNLKGILCDVVPLNGTFSTVYIAFSGCEKLEEINFDLPVDGNATAFNSTFSLCLKLKTIKKIILNGVEYGFGNCFYYCKALENIAFEGDIKASASLSFAQSSVLSNASVQNIIDHLFDYTGDTARTLQLHADVKANMTDAQKAQITAKNWTLA